MRIVGNEMRLKKRMVQNTENSKSSVLHWTQGHPRGTRFQCFARTGDGSVVVGSYDGRIRLYSKGSMRQAKTVFPSLGHPITHVDVTRDGKWILATTDTYLILIRTLFTDKDGKRKTGFHGRMGNKTSAPTLLKLTPEDSQKAGLENKLQAGQFSWVTKCRKEERHLLATVGEFSVLWNFKQVKDSGHECYRNQQGLKSCYCYKLVPKDELIIEQEAPPLVIATPMKVTSTSMSDKLDGSDAQEASPPVIDIPMKFTSITTSIPKDEDDDTEMK